MNKLKMYELIENTFKGEKVDIGNMLRLVENVKQELIGKDITTLLEDYLGVLSINHSSIKLESDKNRFSPNGDIIFKQESLILDIITNTNTLIKSVNILKEYIERARNNQRR